MNLGDTYEGERVNDISYFNGELMKYKTKSHIVWISEIIAKHIKALKDAIATWKQRKKTGTAQEKKGLAQWHLDYLEGQLHEEMKWMESA